ncbi:MAG: ATP-dependent RecD-like DNA helicase [Oscillospiraceae bacterium]|nr:MAG: ATP-dependent RecD-like DNA helicase [Oscillospiraceae bacterium]
MDNIEEKSFEYSSSNDYSSLNEEAPSAVDGKDKISGVVERVVFSNEENGYTVCEISSVSDEGGEILLTLVGIMPFIAEGEVIRAVGKWIVHPSFGKQFSVEYYEKELPSGEASILRYLSSRTVKGVGPSSAKKIVEKFGADTFDVLENHPEWLEEIPGISASKAKVISDSFKQQFGVRSVMMFCHDYIGPASAMKIYKKWGGSSIDTIKSNPYLLCDEIYGMGFERVDRMAVSLGFEGNCPERIMAGIKYLLSYNANSNGHTYIPKDRLITASVRLLSIEENEAESALERLEGMTQVKILCRCGRECVYLSKYYDAEHYIAEKLDLLDRVCPKIDVADLERFIELAETENGITYAKAQRKAIVNVLTSGVMVLTGGPGTGKTTVIRAVISLFEDMKMRVLLSAPTGRAAKRISESTGHEACTVHRMLEMEYSEGREPVYKKNENDTLDADVIIVDESSMMDILLMNALCKAIKPGTRLLLIGDSDQLPSVGAGNVLSDIIRSERYNTVMLREIFRQARASLIITNAHAINNGEYPDLDIKDNDFFFMTRKSAAEIADTVAALCRTRLPNAYGEKIRSKIQVIAPTRKGPAGTEYLNVLLQRGLNPPDQKKKEKKFRDIVFREGDKIMQVRNNYELEWEKSGITGTVTEGNGIFNGDIGFIEQIRPGEETVVLNFEGRIAVYDYTQLDEIEHAYAITVHKSQGSEYPVVIIPLYQSSPRLMTRNLLYTAVTRAKEMVILVGTKDMVAGMIQNNRLTNRYTGLYEEIRENDIQ